MGKTFYNSVADNKNAVIVFEKTQFPVVLL